MHCKLTWHKVLHKSCRDPEIVLQIPNGSQSLGELGALEWRVKVRSHCLGPLSRCGRRQDLFHVDLGGVIPRITGGAVSCFLPIRASFLQTFQREIGE